MTPNSYRHPAVIQRLDAPRTTAEAEGYASAGAPVPAQTHATRRTDTRRWWLIGYYRGRDARPGRTRRIAEMRR